VTPAAGARRELLVPAAVGQPPDEGVHTARLPESRQAAIDRPFASRATNRQPVPSRSIVA
jgi:hypothetical protein